MSIAKCPPAAILPVIFIPGIMGSRLKSNTHDDAWDPPMPWPKKLPVEATRAANPSLEAEDWQIGASGNVDLEGRARSALHKRANSELPGWGTTIDWSTSGAAARRARLVGEPGRKFSESFLKVNKGSAREFTARISADIVDECIDRGWGGLVWEFYGGFMLWLRNSASAEMCPGGTVKIEAWAYPYNWSASNGTAGKELAGIVRRAYSEARAKYKDDPQGRPVLKPVIITHSMGGLVARAYSHLYGGAGDIHGIIHGAMPTFGAPAAYKRMRLGFEGVSSLVLGYNGAEVTALLANMPGGLQLLPTKLHLSADGGSKWLYMDGEPPRPISGDPYQEIYSNEIDDWRLIVKQWIDPNSKDLERSFYQYLNCLDEASKFHEKLAGYYHPNTKFLYAASEQCWDRIISHQNRSSISAIDPSFDASMEAPYLYAIDGPTAKGDGTVHVGSNKSAPKKVESTSKHTETERPFVFQHDQTYAKPDVRSQIAIWLREMVEEQVG